MNPTVAQLFIIFLYFLIAAVVIRAILSWLPISPRSEFVRLIYRITEPLLDPVRRVMPRTGIIDLSAMLVLIVLMLMVQVVQRVSA